MVECADGRAVATGLSCIHEAEAAGERRCRQSVVPSPGSRETRQSSVATGRNGQGDGAPLTVAGQNGLRGWAKKKFGGQDGHGTDPAQQLSVRSVNYVQVDFQGMLFVESRQSARRAGEK